MHSWCHGSPGTVGLFILLNRQSGTVHTLEVARRSALGLAGETGVDAGKLAFANPTLCCGAAGCLDAFTSVYQATKDEVFLTHAQSMEAAIAAELRTEGKCRVYAMYDDEDAQAKKFPYYPTGFMVGNAGLGMAMLRLSAVASGTADKLILLPDHPFAVAVEKKGEKK